MDWFASHLSAQLVCFFGQFWCPSCEGVDAFAKVWASQNGWFFPPSYLVSRVLEQMVKTGAEGTLLFSCWPSQQWWHRLPADDQTPVWFVKVWRDLVVACNLFVSSGEVHNCFMAGYLSSRMLAIRVCCCCEQKVQTCICQSFDSCHFLDVEQEP